MRTWAALAAQVAQRSNLVHGATTAQSRLRLFGTEENAVRVTFYRDHHAWCPYCQKIWLYLEEKRIPYRVKKVTMFCYGNKESWFKAVVPSGMLPAVEIDGRLVTESDVILEKLEAAFGALGGAAMNDRFTVELRQLERQLFSAWCRWLCHSNSRASEEQARSNFDAVAGRVDAALAKSGGPFFRGADFSTADLVFVPYVERMSASLLYYKGYALRDSEKFPRFSAWFDALEKRETYRGTQSDFHTHCHDLPPQMGGCYENGAPEQQRIKAAIDARGLATRDDFGLRAKEASYSEPADAAFIAADRVAKYRETLCKINPECSDAAKLDAALLTTLNNMLDGSREAPPKGTAAALRYIRDRVNVPRDMPIWSARRLCASLEETAFLDSAAQPRKTIALDNRRDQDPKPFVDAAMAAA